MKKNQVTLLALTALCAASTAHAAISFAAYHGTTTDASTSVFTQLGNASSGNSILGYDLMLGVGINPQQATYESNATTGNTRYSRFQTDLRGGQNEFKLQAGSYVAPTGYDSDTNADAWNVTSWANSLIDPNNGAFLRMSSENWPDDGNTTDIGTPWHGFQEGLNWALTASNDSSTLGSATVGSLEVYAVGIVWSDLDEDGNIDSGDQLYLRYLLGADTFAEIDTLAKLNAAVSVPEPDTYALFAGLLGLSYVMVRRRRA